MFIDRVCDKKHLETTSVIHFYWLPPCHLFFFFNQNSGSSLLWRMLPPHFFAVIWDWSYPNPRNGLCLAEASPKIISSLGIVTDLRTSARSNLVLTEKYLPRISDRKLPRSSSHYWKRYPIFLRLCSMKTWGLAWHRASEFWSLVMMPTYRGDQSRKNYRDTDPEPQG